ncbi:hypothetical protein BGW80DRAFT_143826 [Lactifluus volemus]|nr:hypothetical protein BGW80DRAFT_143826 [Lactifluus volemus]
MLILMCRDNIISSRGRDTPSVAGTFSNSPSFIPLEWPEHEDFFLRAISINPNFVSRSAACRHLFFFVGTSICTSSINAAPWCLVGSMLSDESECQLRIRLWGGFSLSTVVAHHFNVVVYFLSHQMIPIRHGPCDRIHCGPT